MFPLKDNIVNKRFPFFTILIIVLNVYFFMHELSLGKDLEKFIFSNGVVPKILLTFDFIDMKGFIKHIEPLIYANFLHGGWFHLIGNMWFLWIFGSSLESYMGHFRFPFFYLFCGIGGYLAHVFTNAQSMIPSIGASGAIAGVLGAYFFIFPGSRIVTLVLLFFFLTTIEIPAFIFLGFWFITQFLNGMSCFSSVECTKGGVAWWAHIGGFLSGFIYILINRKSFKKRRRYV